MSAGPQATGERRNRAALLFILACLWIAAALTGGRIAAIHASALWSDAVRQCVTALLLAAGLYTIAVLGIDDLRPLSSIGFVQRPSARREFALGVALGWGIALVLVLPGVLTRSLNLNVSFDGAHWARLLLSMVALAGFAFSLQMIVAGLPSRLLIRTAGPSWTVVVMLLMAFSAVLSGRLGGDGGIVFAMLAVALFTAAFLRTRAIWLPLGVQLGWTLILQLLFGVPSPYTPVSSGVVRTDMGGASWLTGGPAGVETSVVAPLVLVAALFVLFRMTRDYAWHYTYQPLQGAGHPVEVQPPAAHTREQARVAEPLIQIGGITPAPPAQSTDSNPF